MRAHALAQTADCSILGDQSAVPHVAVPPCTHLDVGFDELLQQLLQLPGVVRPVHNRVARALVELGQRTQLAAIPLDDVCSNQESSGSLV